MSDVIVRLLNKHYNIKKLIRDIDTKIDYNAMQPFEAIDLLLYDFEYFVDKIPNNVFQKGTDWTLHPFKVLVQKHPTFLNKLPKNMLRSSQPWINFNKRSHNLDFLHYVEFDKMDAWLQLKMIKHFKLEVLLKYVKAEDIMYVNVRDILIGENSVRRNVSEDTTFGSLATFSAFYDKFSGAVWGELLEHHRGNVKRTAHRHCRWEKLSASTIVDLVIKDKNKYVEHLDLHKLTKSSWSRLVRHYPEYSNTEEHFAFKLRGKKQ